MTDAAQSEPQATPQKTGFAALELDTRLLGMIGAFNVRDFHSKAEVVVAPAIKTEGKIYQMAGLGS